MDYTDIKNKLKEDLSQERYLHSIGTADCASELARIYGEDEGKAYLAGLLHDCAKCFPKEKLLEMTEKYVPIEISERENYKTLHAPVSAYVAQKDFGVTDSEILSAIRWHTLGKLDMTNFEKIIFLADKIEPNTRDKSYAQNIKSVLKEQNGLNKAILMCYKETIKSLVARDLKICTLTVEIYNKLQTMVQK